MVPTVEVTERVGAMDRTISATRYETLAKPESRQLQEHLAGPWHFSKLIAFLLPFYSCDDSMYLSPEPHLERAYLNHRSDGLH